MNVEVCEETTDTEQDRDWITRRRFFRVPEYGSACLFVTRTFKLLSSDNQWNVHRGKVVGIASRRDDMKTIYFKFYDTDKYRTPPSNNNAYKYALCSSFMTRDAKKAVIEWEGKKEINGNGLVGRKVRRQFISRWYVGKVTKYDSSRKLYKIVYEDDDEEEVTEKVLLQILRPE